MNAQRRRGIVLLIAVMVSVLASNVARAQGGRTVYVDDTGTANAGRDGRCGRPNYNTIQAAVNDMSVTHIEVCPGTYQEQVRVERSLTLEGRSGAVIQAPVVGVGCIVCFTAPQESRLRGFTITGLGASEVGAGVLVSGDSLTEVRVTMTHNHIHDIPDGPDPFINGTGIDVNGGWADITENMIERYDYQGIAVAGTSGFAMVDDNIIRGKGLPSNFAGVAFLEGAAGDMEDNMIAGNNYGIFASFSNELSLRDNMLTANDVGVRLRAMGGTEVRSNEVRNNTSDGIQLDNTSDALVVENEVVDNGGDGIALFFEFDEETGDTSDNLIDSNEVSDNGGDGVSLGVGVVNNRISDNEVEDNDGLDILDENGEPLANDYEDNECDDSNPDGLCDE